MTRKPRPASRQSIEDTGQSAPLLRSPFLWLAVLVVIAGAITIVLAATGDKDEPAVGTAAETAFAEIVGSPLPPLEAPDLAIGMTVPGINAQTFAGERVNIAPDGTARLYGFFAHWCPHCQRELPAVVDWLSQNDLPGGVDIVAVSTAVDADAANYPPSAWFARERWPGSVVVDNENRSLALSFGLTGFPYWVAADADGKVVARFAGSLSPEQLGGLVDQLAATAAPAAAASGDASVGPGVRLVSATHGAAMLADPPDNLVVLDVRTPEEFDAGHLDGAVMLDFYRDDFADRLAELDPDVPYLVYCRSGNRSGQATAIMEQLGFVDVADVDGGINAWTQAGLSTTGS